MCGFSGVLFSHPDLKNSFQPGLQGFRRAAARVSHRGDTDHQEYLADNYWLSHYRLAFQDVQAGRQPMRSHDGQHIIVFNGELYNHLDLRDQLSRRHNIPFRTRSDTETILEGWKCLGEDFFKQFDGEFAFVILDITGKRFVAHRDFHGVKPLFLRLHGIDSRRFALMQEKYAFATPGIEFSSEIKGLASRKQWCRQGLLRQYTGLFEPICTPFQEIIHLPPGATLEGRLQDDRFHCVLHNNHRPIRKPQAGPAASTEELEAALHEAVSRRTLSDVELGVYLSGGIDSKAIAYELSRSRDTRQAIKSFTIGFQQSGYDETEEALRFARHLGFAPHVIRIDDAALNYSYPLAVQTSEVIQPFTNGAAKWWLSLFARQYVQGVLTGDGADEVFCGYPGYRYVNWWRFAMRGRGKAKTVGEVLTLLKNRPLGQSWRDSLYYKRFAAASENPWLSGSSAEGDGSDFIQSLQILGVPHPLFGQVRAITCALLGEQSGLQWLQEQADSVQSIYLSGLPELAGELANPQQALLLWQNYFAKSHLPVLILNWVGDRMEMANTLEGRTPFMSRPVYDVMSKQKDPLVVHGLRDKVLLRQTYARLFPARFAATPKKQFNAPFLNSEPLIRQFQTHDILEKTGIADKTVFDRIGKAMKSTKTTDAYLATHLQSAFQTAICLSIVDRSLVQEQPVLRDEAMQNRYLQNSGAIK